MLAIACQHNWTSPSRLGLMRCRLCGALARLEAANPPRVVEEWKEPW